MTLNDADIEVEVEIEIVAEDVKDSGKLVDLAEECDEEWMEDSDKYSTEKLLRNHPSDYFTLEPQTQPQQYCNFFLNFFSSLEKFCDCHCLSAFSSTNNTNLSKNFCPDLANFYVEDNSNVGIVDSEKTKKADDEILGSGRMIFQFRGNLKQVINEDAGLPMMNLNDLRPDLRNCPKIFVS